jgi:DNA polymerase-3 subunit epsilon
MSDTPKYDGYFKCFVDTETTGTDRKLNHLFQISGAIADKNDKVLERFDFKFMPFSLEHVSEEALEKTGMSIAKLCELGDPRKAYRDFVALLGKYCNKYDKTDKMQMIAYNANFDSEFLREFFTLNNDNYFGSWFWNPAVCVMQSAAMFLINVRGALPNFKLETLCQSAGLGWDEKRAHDAQYDITQTIKLYKYLRDNTRILGE